MENKFRSSFYTALFMVLCSISTFIAALADGEDGDGLEWKEFACKSSGGQPELDSIETTTESGFVHSIYFCRYEKKATQAEAHTFARLEMRTLTSDDGQPSQTIQAFLRHNLPSEKIITVELEDGSHVTFDSTLESRKSNRVKPSSYCTKVARGSYVPFNRKTMKHVSEGVEGVCRFDDASVIDAATLRNGLLLFPELAKYLENTFNFEK